MRATSCIYPRDVSPGPGRASVERIIVERPISMSEEMLVGCSRAKHDDVFPRPRGIHIGHSVYVKGPRTREPNGPNRALLSLRLRTRAYVSRETFARTHAWTVQ